MPKKKYYEAHREEILRKKRLYHKEVREGKRKVAPYVKTVDISPLLTEARKYNVTNEALAQLMGLSRERIRQLYESKKAVPQTAESMKTALKYLVSPRERLRVDTAVDQAARWFRYAMTHDYPITYKERRTWVDGRNSFATVMGIRPEHGSQYLKRAKADFEAKNPKVGRSTLRSIQRQFWRHGIVV